MKRIYGLNGKNYLDRHENLYSKFASKKNLLKIDCFFIRENSENDFYGNIYYFDSSKFDKLKDGEYIPSLNDERYGYKVEALDDSIVRIYEAPMSILKSWTNEEVEKKIAQVLQKRNYNLIRNKAKRDEIKQFKVDLPKEEFEEIDSILKKKNITKVDFVKKSAELLKSGELFVDNENSK